MIEQIQLFLKDPAKVGRAATVAFFVMVAISTWYLAWFGNDLEEMGWINSHRGTAAFAKLFVVIGLTFAFCYATIFFMQRTKKETIVYLDKKIENASSQSSTAGQSHDSLDFNSLKEKIKSGKKDEKWQAGLNELCKQLNAGQGALYTTNKKGEVKTIELTSGYALVLAEGEQNPSFNWEEGLIGQVAASGKAEYLDEMPEGYAARIESGLGGSLPKFLFIFPIKKENECIGVIEVATFTHLSDSLRKQAQEAGNILSEIS
jgi:hypothetical protein